LTDAAPTASSNWLLSRLTSFKSDSFIISNLGINSW